MSENIETAETKQKHVADNVYWHDGIAALLPTTPLPLGKVDVAVIGAGFSGLSAALELRRLG